MKTSYLTSLVTFALLLTTSVNVGAQTLGDDAPVTPSNFCVSLTRDMGYRATDGQVGGEVSALQDYLQTKGYLDSEPTGFFGRLTVAAAKSFQTANGIRPTGYVGPVTRAKIQSLSCVGSSMNTTQTSNSQSNFNDRQAVTGNSNPNVSFGTPINVKAGEKILFSWSANFPYIPNEKDWIGLVPKGHVWKAGDGATYKWVYTYGKKTGSGEIQGPTTSGLYDLVYFENDLLKEVARSSSINVVSSAGLQVQTTSSNTQTTTTTNNSSSVPTIPILNLETVGDIKPNSVYTIKWTSSNTRSCSSPNGSITVNGTSTNLPTSGSIDKTYVLGTSPQFQINCVGDGGYASRTIAITAVNTTQTLNTTTTNTNTQNQDNIAPSVPTNLDSSNVTSNSATITWTGSSDNVRVAGYRIYRNNNYLTSTPSTSYTDSNINSATTYTYNVAAFDTSGNQSQLSSTKSVTTLQGTTQATTTVSTLDTTKPTAPTNLVSSAVTASSLNLSWNASTDNVGVTGYKVYRNGTLIGSPTGTSLSVTGLSASTQYSFTVTAHDSAGNISLTSSTLFVTTSSTADTQAPSTPSSLTATAVSANQINLSWGASSDNVGVVNYKVYSGSNVIATLNSLSYSQTGLTSATSYSYRVSAVDASGNESSLSSYVYATTQTQFVPTSSLNPIDAFTGATFDMSGGSVILTDNPTNCVSTVTTGCGRLSGLHQFANSGENVNVTYNLTGLTPRANDAIVIIQYTTSGLVISTEKAISNPTTSGSISMQLPTYVSGTYNGNTRYGLYYIAYVQKTSADAYRYIDVDWIGIYASGMNPY